MGDRSGGGSGRWTDVDAPGGDQHGFGDTMRTPSSYVARFLGRFVPAAIARRALRVRVEPDRERYAVGDPVAFVVEFYNPLPVAVSVRTRGRRLWGWSVDGDVGGSDEPRYVGTAPRVVRFGARERKRVRKEWSGRFKRTGDPTRWVDPEPGEHELVAFLDLGDDRPEGRATVRFE